MGFAFLAAHFLPTTQQNNADISALGLPKAIHLATSLWRFCGFFVIWQSHEALAVFFRKKHPHKRHFWPMSRQLIFVSHLLNEKKTT
jgi:hypothetical protein